MTDVPKLIQNVLETLNGVYNKPMPIDLTELRNAAEALKNSLSPVAQNFIRVVEAESDEDMESPGEDVESPEPGLEYHATELVITVRTIKDDMMFHDVIDLLERVWELSTASQKFTK